MLVEFQNRFLLNQFPEDVEGALEFLKAQDREIIKDLVIPETGDCLTHCLVRSRSVVLCEKLFKLDPSLISVTTTNSENFTALELSLSLGFSDMFGLLSGHIDASISDIKERRIARHAEKTKNYGQLACILLILISRSVDDIGKNK